MATKIATTDAPKAVAKAPVVAGGALRAFVPSTLEEAWRLSQALAASDMLPKAYGRDPNKVMVGILAGAEVGLTPFVALQSIAVINGTPSMWGDGMLGLVEASGLLEDFEETDDGKTATCRAKRKGRKTEIVRTFSIDDAKTAGLLGKQGPHTQYPKRMRQLRARGFCLRDGFSDVLKGIKPAEEIRDYATMDGGALLGQRTNVTAAMIEQQASEDIDEQTGEVINEGRGVSDMGEANTIDATEIIAFINAKVTAMDVNSMVSSHRDAIERMSEDDQQAIRDAAMEKIEAIKRAAAK